MEKKEEREREKPLFRRRESAKREEKEERIKRRREEKLRIYYASESTGPDLSLSFPSLSPQISNSLYRSLNNLSLSAEENSSLSLNRFSRSPMSLLLRQRRTDFAKSL